MQITRWTIKKKIFLKWKKYGTRLNTGSKVIYKNISTLRILTPSYFVFWNSQKEAIDCHVTQGPCLSYVHKEFHLHSSVNKLEKKWFKCTINILDSYRDISPYRLLLERHSSFSSDSEDVGSYLLTAIR